MDVWRVVERGRERRGREEGGKGWREGSRAVKMGRTVKKGQTVQRRRKMQG